MEIPRVAWWLLVVLLVATAVHLATTAVVRWADDRRVRRPLRPRCVTDHHDLALRELVPLWSWLRARGHCRTCGRSIPPSLPLVEVAVVVVLGLVARHHPGVELVLLGPVAWSAVVATPIDLERMVIPNRLTYPLAAWSLLTATGLAATTDAWVDWRRAVLVGLVLPAGMLGLSLAFELVRGDPGMGMGDVKWAVSLGTAVGWLGSAATAAFLLATAVTAGVVAVVLLARGRAGSTRMPFGPYLAVGTVVALAGPPDTLARLLGPG